MQYASVEDYVGFSMDFSGKGSAMVKWILSMDSMFDAIQIR